MCHVHATRGYVTPSGVARPETDVYGASHPVKPDDIALTL